MTTARTVLRGDSVTFTLDGSEYTADISAVTITSAANKDASTFAAPAFDYTMKLTGLQSDDSNSLYQLFSDPTNLGRVVTFVVKTSATGSTANGSARIPWNLPDWGGDQNAVWKQSFTLDVIGTPAFTPAV